MSNPIITINGIEAEGIPECSGINIEFGFGNEEYAIATIPVVIPRDVAIDLINELSKEKVHMTVSRYRF